MTVANRERVFYTGRCSNVPIRIDSLLFYTTLYITKSSSLDIILGTPFMRRSTMILEYNDRGECEGRIKSNNRIEVFWFATFSRNRINRID